MSVPVGIASTVIGGDPIMSKSLPAGSTRGVTNVVLMVVTAPSLAKSTECRGNPIANGTVPSTLGSASSLPAWLRDMVL